MLSQPQRPQPKAHVPPAATSPPPKASLAPPIRIAPPSREKPRAIGATGTAVGARMMAAAPAEAPAPALTCAPTPNLARGGEAKGQNGERCGDGGGGAEKEAGGCAEVEPSKEDDR